MGTFRIQTHGRLQEWVAEEKGYFADEGLEYEFIGNPLMNEQVTVHTDVDQHESGAFEKMEEGLSCEVGSACHWAVNQAASESLGRMWGKAYTMTPSGIYVGPDSKVRKPEDLAGVEIGVGYHSGSHFSALSALQEILAPEDINLVYKGGPTDRMTRMVEGSIEAANVFGNPMYVLEQLGFHKIVDTSFMIGFFIDSDADVADVEKYMKALQRAQRDIDSAPEKYKHYWLKELTPEFRDRVDVRGFGMGERIVFEPYSRELFDTTREWMETNGLFDDDQAPVRYEEAILA